MRSQIRRIELLALALLLAATLGAQQTPTRSVTVTVSDISGSGIARAQIRLVPAPDPAPPKLETDPQGHLALNLKPGTYSVFVSAQGFKEKILHIDVAASPSGSETGSTSAQLVPVTLQPGDTGSPVPVYPKDSLVITADRLHVPVALSLADFNALPHTTVKVHNVHTDADESYSGVPLATLLAMVEAPLGNKLRGEALANYLIASGSDGYSVVLSLSEVDPGFHSGQVLVADSRDGAPLAKSGPFQLIVTDDKRPARWVHNLVSIALLSAR
jgi:hypothetical protein